MDNDRSRDLQRAAKLAVALLILVIGVDLVAIAFDIVEEGLIPDFRRGDLSAARAADSRRLAVSIAELVALVLSAATFLHWFRMAYRNLTALGVRERELRHSPGWSVGAWFMPIIAFFWPKQLANDIWRASDPEKEPVVWPRRSVSPLLNWWWAAWLLSNLVDRLTNNAFDHVDDLDRLSSAHQHITSLVVEIVAGFLAISVVHALTARQRSALASERAGELQPATQAAP